MSELTPQNALDEIERTQQEAYTRQHLPLWYPPAFVGAMTVYQIGLDQDPGWMFGILLIVGLALMIAGVGLMLRGARVRWNKKTMTRASTAVYVAWVLVGVAVAFGCHDLVFDGMDQPYRKIASGLVTAVYFVVTLRAFETLILRMSKGKVVS